MASGGPGGILPQDCHRGLRQEQGSNFFFFFLADRVLVRDLGKFFQFPSVSFLFSKGNLSREG